MNLIDHRILIPTSPERVWHFVGDLKRNTEWQTNCRSISLLTSATKIQPGTRLRITPERGREQVIEITAWYDRFGYEYMVVEGSSFRENKGTVRLQEVPEGTIVQWTFSYKPGLLGGGNARAQESIIIDSLRGLYKLITKSKEVETFQAKSLMRDDPGVEARATYRPRHPYGDTAEGSAGRVKSVPRQPTRPQTPVAFSEPPVKLEDTKPRPVVVTDEPAPMPTPVETQPPVAPPAPVAYMPNSPVVEPDFLIEEPYTPAIDVPSETIAPVTGTPIPPMPPVTFTPPPITPVEVPVIQPINQPPPAIPEPPTTGTDTKQHAATQDPLSDTASKVRQDTSPIAVSYPTPAEVPVSKPAPAPRRDKLTDTAKISVFDVFGLPKPSETQEIKPLVLDANGDPLPVAPATVSGITENADIPAAVAPTPDTPSKPVVSEARRFGRRAIMRRKFVKIRLPY
jgi:hypothetical protein